MKIKNWKIKKNVLVLVIYRKLKKMDLSLDNGFYINYMRRALHLARFMSIELM